jgi:dihydroorotate dehydrogenase (NAD+) catalytic subunit
MEPNIKVNIFNIKLENPLILASGVLGTTLSILEKVGLSGAGAVTIKSISVEPRFGHPNPTVLDFGNGLINAVGYSNPGLRDAVEEFKNLKNINCPIIGSIIGTKIEDFKKVAENFDKLDFAAIEVPISCPHTPGFGKIGNQDDPEFIYKIAAAICSVTSKPLIIKVPPVADNLIEMAIAAKQGGASGINAVNTVGPAMLIDIDSGKPYLGFGIGGISGPALKPLAIYSVYQLYKAVDLPIIGTGGISSGRDVIEMIMAGATAVGIGSAVLTRGIHVFQKITTEITEYLIDKNINDINKLKGLSHHD